MPKITQLTNESNNLAFLIYYDKLNYLQNKTPRTNFRPYLPTSANSGSWLENRMLCFQSGAHTSPARSMQLALQTTICPIWLVKDILVPLANVHLLFPTLCEPKFQAYNTFCLGYLPFIISNYNLCLQ